MTTETGQYIGAETVRFFVSYFAPYNTLYVVFTILSLEPALNRSSLCACHDSVAKPVWNSANIKKTTEPTVSCSIPTRSGSKMF